MRWFSEASPCFLDHFSRCGIWVAVVLLVGCGGSSGPPRFSVTGKVTYDGQPVPFGEIVFEPDPDAGNSGPTTSIEFKDGVYSLKGDKGFIGGPAIVRIIGYDGKPPEGGMNPKGMQLFPAYRTKVDIPKKEGTQDFAVPKEP